MFSLVDILPYFVRTICAGFEAWSATKQIELQRLALDELAKYDQDETETKKQITLLRKSGNDTGADTLIDLLQDRAQLRASATRALSIPERWGLVHSGNGGEMGESGTFGNQGRADSDADNNNQSDGSQGVDK